MSHRWHLTAAVVIFVACHSQSRLFISQCQFNPSNIRTYFLRSGKVLKLKNNQRKLGRITESP